VTTPSLAECTGLWRRTLLIEADGSRDTSTGVVWLQGISAYADSRGFAGHLHQNGAVFEWHRDVDVEPPGPLPDAGSMHWDGDTLVETGVYADYVEHWVRDDADPVPCGAFFLSSHVGNGLLLRVGELFAFAGGETVLIGPVGGPQWEALAIETSSDQLQANGVRWTIDRSEGNVNP
jgi:hypothetical protein